MTSESTSAPGGVEVAWIVAGAAFTLAVIAALLGWMREEREFVRDARRGAAADGRAQERRGDESS